MESGITAPSVEALIRLITTPTKSAMPAMLWRRAESWAGFLTYSAGLHVIYFRDRGDQLEVIRVLHQKQDAERHLCHGIIWRPLTSF
jgi:plasmid stabilization system protein ParE